MMQALACGEDLGLVNCRIFQPYWHDERMGKSYFSSSIFILRFFRYAYLPLPCALIPSKSSWCVLDEDGLMSRSEKAPSDFARRSLAPSVEF